MVLHVNQAAIVVIRNWFHVSERVFFSVLKSAAKTYEWIVEIANIRKSKQIMIRVVK